MYEFNEGVKYVDRPTICKQGALEEAHEGGRVSDVEVWRRRLHGYLDGIFRIDTEAAVEYHYLQVSLIVPV